MTVANVNFFTDNDRKTRQPRASLTYFHTWPNLSQMLYVSICVKLNQAVFTEVLTFVKLDLWPIEVKIGTQITTTLGNVHANFVSLCLVIFQLGIRTGQMNKTQSQQLQTLFASVHKESNCRMNVECSWWAEHFVKYRKWNNSFSLSQTFIQTQKPLNSFQKT